MNSDVEAQVWRLCCSLYPAELPQTLHEALACFRRRPGLDDLARLNHAALSSLGFELLSSALQCHSRRVWYVHHGDHIELRWEVRLHLKRFLQQRLLDDGHADGLVRDDYFSIDLGL